VIYRLFIYGKQLTFFKSAKKFKEYIKNYYPSVGESYLNAVIRKAKNTGKRQTIYKYEIEISKSKK